MRHYSVWQLIVVGALLATGQALADGDANAGQEKSATCAGCHGANGEGMDPNPPIAGMDVESFTAAINAYKSGEREEPMMGMLAAPLSDQDIADLAAYYASLSGAE
jgi:cytochrome c553